MTILQTRTTGVPGLQPGLCSFLHIFVFTRVQSWPSLRDLGFFPSLLGSAQLRTPTPQPGKGQVPASENSSVPLPQILGFLEPALQAGSGPELGVGSLGLIGTLPGPAARGLLGASWCSHSILWWLLPGLGTSPGTQWGIALPACRTSPHSHVSTYLVPLPPPQAVASLG